MRTRAQNLAMTIESAPRSSKTWASVGTSARSRTPASTSASSASVAPPGATAGAGAGRVESGDRDTEAARLRAGASGRPAVGAGRPHDPSPAPLDVRLGASTPARRVGARPTRRGVVAAGARTSLLRGVTASSWAGRRAHGSGRPGVGGDLDRRLEAARRPKCSPSQDGGRRCRGSAPRGPGRWRRPSGRARRTGPATRRTADDGPGGAAEHVPAAARRWQARIASSSSTTTTSSTRDVVELWRGHAHARAPG